MKNKLFLFLVGLLSFFNLSFSFLHQAHAMELDWHSVHFGSINYSRAGIEGGASLYSLPSKDTLKFKIQFVFPNSLFSMPESDITTVNAMASLLILGGFGGKTYEQIQKELMQNGIVLNTSVNEIGRLVVSCEALSEDFGRVLNLMSELILTPKFDSNALILWKQQSKNQYIDIGNANTLNKQMLFINVENARLTFGRQSYQANLLLRASPKYTQPVTIKNIKSIYEQMRNRNGLNVLLSGAYPPTARDDVARILMKIPTKNMAIIKWLPGRLQPQSSHLALTTKIKNSAIKTAVIEKSDMTQSQISLRFYYPYIGELNQIEKAQVALLSEIYSSTAGVIGNDRFSKAMRADSGLSYGPNAYFKPDIIDPNTNLAAFIMNFQSPNEKIFEAVTLAKKTWDNFIQKGISVHELDRTRSSMMNSMLANELTVFDKSEMFFSKILHGKVPTINPVQESIELLDAQRNVDPINAFLKDRLAKNTVGILVIMGNPPNDQMEKLKSLSALDFVETKEVNSFL